MTILITGVAGFIGMHSAIKCINLGWDVIGIDDLNDYYDVELKKARVAHINDMIVSSGKRSEFFFYNADINSKIFDKISTKKVEIVLHLAAQAGVRYSLENPRKYTESNIVGFQSVLEYVNKASVSRLIYASSSSVYGDRMIAPFREEDACTNPKSYYAFTKVANELMAKSYYNTHGTRSIGLRFFTVYGPWGRPDMAPILFMNAAYTNEAINVFNHGLQKRDFTYIDDVIDGIFKVIENESQLLEYEIFNIGNGNPTQLMDFIKGIEEVTGKELKKNLTEAQNGDVSMTYASIERINDAVGYRAKTSLKQGLQRLGSWYREYYKNEQHYES